MALRKDGNLIKKVLVDGLNHLNTTPKISVRKSGVGDNLHIYVFSDTFSRWSMTKRHELVESILQRGLPPNLLLKVSALFVLTTKEAEETLPQS